VILVGPLIIVPFYRNSHLVAQIGRSLEVVADELGQIGGGLYLINDSPDDPELGEELGSWAARLQASGVDVQCVANDENIGFIKSCNRGLAVALELNRHALLLNSDTQVSSGFLSQMLEAFNSDPLVGFVCPRSNNATLCTFPHGAEVADWSLAVAEENHRKLSKFLPKFSYVPTGTGFCLLIRWQVLAEFGFLDPVYGKGYNEENDLIMRAGRCGYRVVLANRAFVWHQGEQSFAASSAPKMISELENRRLLDQRYPEYTGLLDRYFKSSAHECEALISLLPGGRNEPFDVVFDFSHFGVYHNGTFEAGKKILKAAIVDWPENIGLKVSMGAQAYSFHGMDAWPRIQRCDQDAFPRAAVLVRFGQHFKQDVLTRSAHAAPILINFFLDTIAHDCSGLSLDFDPAVWQRVCKHYDVILTNSEFTRHQLAARFRVDPAVDLISCLHSVVPEEYVPADHEPMAPPRRDQILVVGNNFPHKFVVETVKAIEKRFGADGLVVFGVARIEGSGATYVASGALTDREAFAMYGQAGVVVFPSHYEGFGFPLMNAIAAGRPIVLRDLPVYREISEFFKGDLPLAFYESTEQMLDLLERVRRGEVAACPWVAAEPDAQISWKTTSDVLLKAIFKRMDVVDSTRLQERIEYFSDLARVGAVSHMPREPKGPIGRLVRSLREMNRERLRRRHLRKLALGGR
jgi:GT2 family glycosyltransferase